MREVDIRPGLYWVEDFDSPLEITGTYSRSVELSEAGLFERGDFYARAYEIDGTVHRVDIAKVMERVA